MTYTVERTSDEVLTVRHKDIVAGWEQRYLLISDVHFDSPYCDRKLLSKHLGQAKELGAGVLAFGDWFDAMGGRNDKRATKSTVLPGDSVPHYFDSLVDSSVDYLASLTDNLVMFADGNHETAILRHNETDLLERLCRQLGCQHMGYSGYVRFMFSATTKHGSTGQRTTKRLYFHHGAGGGGPVTKGVIQSNRRASSVDADIFVSGHIHEAWAVENVMVKLLDSGRIHLATQLHCQLPTYKQEWGRGGYHIEKGRPPKPLGGYWLIFQHDSTQPSNIGYRVERAN
jgi:predicted phosphodiesterase